MEQLHTRLNGPSTFPDNDYITTGDPLTAPERQYLSYVNGPVWTSAGSTTANTAYTIYSGTTGVSSLMEKYMEKYMKESGIAFKDSSTTSHTRKSFFELCKLTK